MSAFAAATPHGALTRVAEDVYTVRGTFAMGPGLLISRTMTLLKQGAELTVINSVRLDHATEAELERLGRVAHVVKLADQHGLDDPYYVRRFDAVFWSLPNARHAALPRGATLGAESPVAAGEVIALGHVRRAEAAYWVPQAGGTLITCDAIQHHCDAEGASSLARLITPLLGFRGGVIVAPMWKRVQGLSGEALRHGLAGLTARPFENLVTGHGPAVIGGALDRVAAAIARA